jgi:hypothetical protein
MQRAIEAAMKELGETTTSEDVAAFLRSEMPELSARRREVVNKAVGDARERGTPAGGTPSDPDVAFAPTVVSERQPNTVPQGGAAADRPSDLGTIALSKRKEPPSGAQRREPPPSTAVSHALDQEPIKIPKTSKAWLWITLVLLAAGGGAYYQWPAEARALLAKVGIGGGSGETGAQPPGEPSATAATSATAPTTATASAVPSAAASAQPAASAPEVPSASASSAPSAHPSAAASGSHAPGASATHHTWPGGQPPPGSAAGSAAPAPTPWSPYKNPQPAPSSDNPYPGAPPPL